MQVGIDSFAAWDDAGIERKVNPVNDDDVDSKYLYAL